MILFITVMQMWKLRFKGLVHGHTAGNQNLNTGLLGSEAWVLFVVLPVSE